MNFYQHARKAMMPMLCLFFIACQKENQLELKSADAELSKSVKPVRRAWMDKFNTVFSFVPDFAGGWVAPNPAPAWYPGTGTGTATHMGNAITYFNQKALLGPGGLYSIPQPVTMFYAAILGQAGIANIPDQVSSIVLDDKGNSVWFASSGSTTTPVSETRITFEATLMIVGGTGKFMGAAGSVKLTGYFNPTDPEDAESTSSGWIEY